MCIAQRRAKEFGEREFDSTGASIPTINALKFLGKFRSP